MRVCVSCSLLAGLGFGNSLVAEAAPVDNPGTFSWNLGPNGLVFNQSSQIKRDSNSGYLEADFASNGDAVFNSFSIGSVSLAPLTTHNVQVLVDPILSFGSLDASIGGNNVSFTLDLRVRITGSGVGSTCITPTFSATLTGTYVYAPVPAQGTLAIYSGTGGSPGTWLTVPALPLGACAGQEGTLNALLGFGSPGQGLRIAGINGLASPAPFGS